MIECKEGESLFENILSEAMHDILESDELDNLIDELEKRPAGLLTDVNDDEPANCDLINQEVVGKETNFNN